MSRRLQQLGTSVDLKFDTERIKARANRILDANSAERKGFMKRGIWKGAVLAAVFTLLFSVSVFALTPTGRETIGNIISYFKNDQADEITSYEALAEYNEEIGASDSAHGYTLTLDNVAADDNFVHVFYTLHSEEKMVEDLGQTLMADPPIEVDVAIDGRIVSGVGNHNTYDGYFEDCNTMKLVQKINIATQDIPDHFKLELMAADSFLASDWNVDLSRFYNMDSQLPPVGLTKEEQSQILYVTAEIDKAEIQVASITKELNVPLWDENTVVEKVVLSPFANQFVLRSTEGDDKDSDGLSTAGIVLFDENDVCLDVLNTDLTGSRDGVVKNSFEFLKADANTRQLKFVPVTSEKVFGELECIDQKIGAYPMTFNLSEYGTVVVTDVRIEDGIIEVDYYKDGYSEGDPEFSFLDSNGNDVCPERQGEPLRCLYDVKINHKDNSYTARYHFYWDEDGNEILAAEAANAELLREQIAVLALRSESNIRLDFDHAVTVSLG